jgi:hypothetical protein
VHVSAYGSAFVNSGGSDVYVQYEIFVDGVATGSYVRTDLLYFSTQYLTNQTGWAVSRAFSLTAGSHTIEIRGAHAGPTGTQPITLCGPAGSITQAQMNIVVSN